MEQPLFIFHEAYEKYRLKNHVIVNNYISFIKKESETLSKNDLLELIKIKKDNLIKELLDSFNVFYDECSENITNERAKEAQKEKPLLFKKYIRDFINEDEYYVSLFEKGINHLL